jgi:signal transduction histidine kinase
MSTPRIAALRGLLRGRSLKAQSAALLAAYALFLAAVYGGFSVLLLRREVAAAHARLEQTARLVAAEIDAHLESGRQRLATVARLPGLVHGLQRLEEARGEGYIPPWTTLHYLFFKSPVFTGGVFLLDRSGTVLWTEPPGLPWLGRTLAAHPAIGELLGGAGTPVSPGLAADGLLTAPHVVIGVPIEGPEGEVAGLLGGVVDLTATGFAAALAAVPTAAGRYLSVVDQAGRVIASTEPARLFTGARDASPASEEAPVARAALRHAPWEVVAGEPRETTLAPIWQLQRLLVGMGLAMLVLALTIGSYFLRGFVRAIARLTASAEVIARGDLSQPVAVDERHLEIATLATTFERMRTEIRRSQAVLTRRLAEREDLIRLKEEFLANVSHELRTPLNVIFGYTDILLERETDAERCDALHRIRAQSEQLLHLLGDLMTLSGLNAGRIALEPSPVAVDDLLGRLRPLMDQLAHGRPITPVCECDGAVPALYTDRLRLEQVLTNLVTNAFKFTDEGSIVLRVRHAADEQRVVFEVVDSGIGIPAHELPYIFDEFRQVDGSMSRRHGGVGLGLALVRRLVELLGGTVTVRSRPGAGSTFIVSLPVDHGRLRSAA